MTLAEILVSAGITVSVMGAALGVADTARRTFQLLPEAADVEQRARAGLDALARDLVMAGAGRHHGSADRCLDDVSIWPVGPDAISILYRPRGQTSVVTRTYFLFEDPQTHVSELTREDESLTRLPVADHIVNLQFSYFADGSTPIDPAFFDDGPWCSTGGTDDEAFDVDLTTIRRVRVTLRVEAALDSVRGVIPDRTFELDVSPRNLTLQ